MEQQGGQQISVESHAVAMLMGPPWHACCRCVYTGEQGAPVDTAEEERGSGRTRRSQRKPRGASGKDKPRLPLLCRAADGSQVAMHTCDLAFITYEQLRKELGQQGRYGIASSTLVSRRCTMSARHSRLPLGHYCD